MPIVYDRNGNEVVVDDVEKACAETWLVHNRTEPRYFRENPDTRVPEQRAADGARRARKRARRRIERFVQKGLVQPDDSHQALNDEVARVRAQFASSGNPKLEAIAERL